LSENWTEGVKQFGRGLITDWVKIDYRDQGLASDLADIAENKELYTEQKLSVVLLVMDDELPLFWKGEVVTPQWLAANPEEAVELCHSNLPQLFDRHRPGNDLNLPRIAGLVNELDADKALQGQNRAVVIGLILDDNASLNWNGQDITAQWLSKNYGPAIKLSQGPILNWYERLRGEDELLIGLRKIMQEEELKRKQEEEKEELKAKQWADWEKENHARSTEENLETDRLQHIKEKEDMWLGFKVIFAVVIVVAALILFMSLLT